MAHCRNWECRLIYREQHLAAKQREDEQLAKQWAEQQASAERVRERAAAAVGIADSQAYLPLLLPSNRHRLVPLPAARRESFTTHVRELLAQLPHSVDPAQKGDDHGETCSEEIRPELLEACATCAGSCCLNGGVRAFLDVQTMRRFRRRVPQADDEEVLETYLRFMPEESYEDSCVFHTASGCQLPRHLRSETCNSAMCQGLVELRSRLREEAQANIFLAAMSGERVVRHRFLERGASEPIPARDASE